MATPAPAGHRRNKSSSVLKSIMVSKGHKRSPSDGTTLGGARPEQHPYNPNAFVGEAPLLPPDHPHSQLRAVNRTQHVSVTQPSSPRKSQDTRSGPTKSLHKKTLSSVSLRSISRDKEGEKEKESRRREPSRTGREDTTNSPKKNKSSTNLVGIFSKGKQTKEGKDKENTTPPSTSNAPEPVHTPIWAQFSSQPLQDITTTTKVPLNDRRRSVEDEMALYTPVNYSPSKQRNFFDYGQPSLQRKEPAKERPISGFLPTNASNSLLESFARKRSGERERVPLGDTKGNEGRVKENTSSKSLARGMLSRTSSETSRDSRTSSPKKAADTSKKPNRVMAAVAAFNGKSKTAVSTPTTSPTKLDPKVVDAEFESVLESRNIPTHQRAAMRTLKLEVKADFVRTHKLDTPQASRAASAHSTVSLSNGNKAAKPGLTRSGHTHDGSMDEMTSQTSKSGESSKRERPRSRTFTFGKGDSPTKKQKGDAASTKTAIIPKSPSSRSLVSNSSQRSVSKGSKSVQPSEFITYLRKTPKPQEVEVGKLHKLRLLLRNETVEWVNQFVEESGMTELVALLHRIMEVEWREEHEDTLLHEVLRCLKGLCTTDSALKQFIGISSTLFPALLAMLFDEEHKGPSEFTTRELVIQIIFAHISTAPESDLPSRAAALLAYLKDPVKEKESSTIPFILQMHQPRPYQVWCKEITNVTKEVFWIFIHHLNVVPLPTPASSETHKSYAKTHFPGQRAIVPAAPYVGGVEWDATNYIATHLDLLNGILASLPNREARNTLRSELKVSGFEKVLGHLRTCNPKYYGAVHDAVRVWIGAAQEDGWEVRDVRMGPPDGKPGVGSPIKQSPKKKAEKAPQIQVPKMEIGNLSLGLGKDVAADTKDDFWN